MTELDSSGLPARRLYVCLLLLCTVGALALAAIAAIPDEILQESLVLVDRDTSRHFLTPNQLFAVKAGAGSLAALLLALAALFVVARNRATSYLAELATDFSAFRQQWRVDWRLPDKADGLALGAILLIGCGLRVYGLDHPWRFDESDSLMHFVRLDWFNLWTDYTQPNNHIFYNFLAHLSVEAFGPHSGASRIPAFLAGVLIVPAVFAVGRMLFDTPVALAATAVAACLPPLVDFSTNARGYGLVTLLLLLSITAASMLRHRRSISAWIVISILMTAALFAIPTALFALGTLLLILWLWAENDRRGPLISEAIGCTAVCGFSSILLYTPPALRATWGAIVSNRFVQPTDWDVILLRVDNYLALLWAPVLQPSVLLTMGIVSAALFVGAKTAGGRRLLFAVLLPAAALCAVGRFIPPPRVWLYTLPFFLLATAAGALTFAGVRGNVRQIALAVCALLALGFSVLRAWTPGFELRFYGQVQQLADELAPQLDPSSAVIVPTPMSDPLQLRITESDPRLKVGFDPRDLRVGRRTLEGRSKIWIVRPQPGAYLGWENGRREFDLAQSYLTEFTDPRLVTATEHLEVWAMQRR